MRNETGDREKERSISYRPLRPELAGVTRRVEEFRICPKIESADWRTSLDPELLHDIRGKSGNPRRGRHYPARRSKDVARSKTFSAACRDACLLLEEIAAVDVDQKWNAPPQVGEKNRVPDRPNVAAVQNVDVPRGARRQPSSPAKLIGENLRPRKRKWLPVDRIALGSIERRGKHQTRKASIRVLKRHLSDVIYRALNADAWRLDDSSQHAA